MCNADLNVSGECTVLVFLQEVSLAQVGQLVAGRAEALVTLLIV